MRKYGQKFQEIAAKERMFPALDDYLNFVELEKALDVLTEKNFLTPDESRRYFEQLERKFQVYIINTGLQPEKAGFVQAGSVNVTEIQMAQKRQKVQAELDKRRVPYYSDEWYRVMVKEGIMQRTSVPSEIAARLNL